MSTSSLASEPTTRQQKIQLEEIERHIYTRQHKKAAQLVLKVLWDIDNRGSGLVMSDATSMTARQRDHQQLEMLSRFAGCLTTLLADPDFKLSQRGFELFMVFKRYITAVFMGSGFGDANHLLALVGQRDRNGKVALVDNHMLRRFFLITTPAAPLEKLNISDMLSKLPPEMSIPFWISFVDPEIVLGRKESERRQQIAMLYEHLPDDYVVSDQMLARVSNAWMFLSYMDFCEKHQPKKYINRLLRRWAESKGVKAPTVVRREIPPGEKTRLLVATEHFRSSHAMHRCYRPAVDSLREHFHTVGLCIDRTIDDEAAEAFDEVHTFPAEEDIRKIAGRIVKLAPDIIYYPSLGMQNWTTVLAQFRFAPIQCMSMGHPATSMSEYIDYAFSGDTDPDLFSERIVFGHARSLKLLPYPGNVDFTRVRQRTDRVRIAVNAKNYKINHRLIEACVAIRDRSNTPVEFVFFPNCKGITYEAFRQELNRYLDAIVYPGTDYKTYIDRLRTCDLVLNPFPFGNTNGINDCVRIGLPFVCMDGPERHSRIDVQMSEELGYPAFCRTDNLDDYIEAALRLVDDEGLRESIISEMVETRAADRILCEPGDKSLLGDAVWKLWWHHEQLQQSDERTIDIELLPEPDPAISRS